MSQPKPESLPRRHTDPAWLQDHFLGTGHDEKTRNATFTFIKRNGRHYAVTCRHVVDSLSDAAIVPAVKNPTIALHVGKAVLNLSYFTAQGLVLGVNSPKGGTAQDGVDVAIASLDGGYWHMLVKDKNKAPIDLDTWREPDWNAVKYCLAAGYPDEHKEKVVGDTGPSVASPFAVVCAEATSKLGRNERLIVLSSALEKPHGYYFSGMSGGPIYAIEGHEQRKVEDEELFPVGIVFEGFPGSGRTDVHNDSDAMTTFLTDRDLFFRALTLTPEIFDEWLRKA
jgi:hypothetical protein